MVTKKFGIQKDSLVFDGVSLSYTFIARLVIIINCVSFPSKGDYCSFVVVKFHTVASP
jgi:hypothetical protein